MTFTFESNQPPVDRTSKRDTRIIWGDQPPGWYVTAFWQPEPTTPIRLEGPFQSYKDALPMGERLRGQYDSVQWLGRPITSLAREELLQVIDHLLNTIRLMERRENERSQPKDDDSPAPPVET